MHFYPNSAKVPMRKSLFLMVICPIAIAIAIDIDIGEALDACKHPQPTTYSEVYRIDFTAILTSTPPSPGAKHIYRGGDQNTDV